MTLFRVFLQWALNCMVNPTNNGQKSKKNTRFAPGNPGGPGRPQGSRNAATLILDQLADGEAGDILRRVVAEARGGDMRAAEMILSRAWPARKGRRVSVDLPRVDTAADVTAALGALLEATATGSLTPEEAASIGSLLESKRRAIETVDLEQRIATLEASKKDTN